MISGLHYSKTHAIQLRAWKDTGLKWVVLCQPPESRPSRVELVQSGCVTRELWRITAR
jgi:hypothetical protein